MELKDDLSAPQQKGSSMSSRTIVFVALKPSHAIPGVQASSRVGYFATEEEIQPPWVPNKYGPTKDISYLMKYYGWETVAQALQTMNR